MALIRTILMEMRRVQVGVLHGEVARSADTAHLVLSYGMRRGTYMTRYTGPLLACTLTLTCALPRGLANTQYLLYITTVCLHALYEILALY